MPFLALEVRNRYDQPGSSGSSSGSMTVGSLNGKSDWLQRSLSFRSILRYWFFWIFLVYICESVLGYYSSVPFSLFHPFSMDRLMFESSIFVWGAFEEHLVHFCSFLFTAQQHLFIEVNSSDAVNPTQLGGPMRNRGVMECYSNHIELFAKFQPLFEVFLNTPSPDCVKMQLPYPKTRQSQLSVSSIRPRLKSLWDSCWRRWPATVETDAGFSW